MLMMPLLHVSRHPSGMFPHSAGAAEAWAAGFSVAASAGNAAQQALNAKKQININNNVDGQLFPPGSLQTIIKGSYLPQNMGKRQEKKTGQSTLQSRVAGRYEWRTGVKAKRCPGLGPGRSTGIIGRWDLRGEAGAKASRPPFRRSGVFFESRVIPADASGALPPAPPGPNKTCSGPPRLNGYLSQKMYLAFLKRDVVISVWFLFSKA